MSKVLPILFNTEMVRAILDSRKTVTRRIIKQEKYIGVLQSTSRKRNPDIPDEYYIERLVKPQCEVGDVLYVRETWTKLYYVDPDGYTHYDQKMYFYAADGVPDISLVDADGFEEDDQRIRWRPSIHMPKDAARIWLKVTDVRVERLQEITEEQAIREGIARLYDDLSDAEYIDWAKRTGIYPKAKEDWGYKNYLWHGSFGLHGTGNKLSDAWEYQYSSYDSAIDSFSSLWNATVPLKVWNTYGWAANPWVWVIEFGRCGNPGE